MSRTPRAASRISSSTCSSRARRRARPQQIAQAIDSIGGQLDAFTAKEYASYFIKVLDEHVPIAHRSAERHGHASRAGARRRRERAERDPRRDQDGRGRARRSGARDVRAAVLVAPSARPADSRHARHGLVLLVRRSPQVLRTHLRRVASRGRGRRPSRARDDARSGRPGVRDAAGAPAVDARACRPASRPASSSATRTSSRVTSASARAPIRMRTRIGTCSTCSTRSWAAR